MTSFRPHGSGIRGLSNVKRLAPAPVRPRKVSGRDFVVDRFGRLFALDPAQFPEKALLGLAEAMNGDASVKDGADPEESHIPAAYTYLGQFIDHDLTFDPSTFAQQKRDPWAVEDFRTPRFDLDNLYGRGPDDQPYLYDGAKLQVGPRELKGAERNPRAHDLARAQATSQGAQRAIIGDPRNDENVIVSQLHGMFIRFHNRLVDEYPKKSFQEIAQKVRWHYQWMVVHDFLPRIVSPDVLDAVWPAIRDPSRGYGRKPRLVLCDDKFLEAVFMPVEFSVASYRFGHSMVRPGYRVNESVHPLPIFAGRDRPSLSAFGEFPGNLAIDWQRFVDLGLRRGPETEKDRVQLAYNIDTSLAGPLSHLPLSVAGQEAKGHRPLVQLAYRNLLRGTLLGLPTGQELARRMKRLGLKLDVLPDERILIGPAEPEATEEKGTTPIASISRAFKGHCPLWVYVLAEARHNFFESGKAMLGPVGGRIVTEVVLALLLSDRPDRPRRLEPAGYEGSFLNAKAHWTPDLGKKKSFDLADLLRFALGY